MKKTFQRLLSVLLTLTLIVSCMPMDTAAFFGGAAKKDVVLQFTTDKRYYALGETVTLTVTATNTTDDVKSVKVTVDPQQDALFTFEKCFNIENIPAHGTKTVEYQMTVADHEYRSLFGNLLNLFAGIFYSYIRFDYKININANYRNRSVGFTMCYNVPQVNKELAFNTDSMQFIDELDAYVGIDGFEDFTGTLLNSENIKSFKFSITDPKGFLVSTGDVDINENWTMDNYSLVDGVNVIEVTAVTHSNKTLTDEIKYYSEYLYNIDNSELDIGDDDNDGLNNYLEEYYGSDPKTSDTDDDGLDDYTELNSLNLDPNKKDTDNDGILDYDEDNDGDGYSNGYEISIGLDPTAKDSDCDALDDNVEIEKHNTDPLNGDTDGDGVSDGDEVLLGTDPLVKQETFNLTADCGEVSEDNPISPSVEVKTGSSGVGSLEISEVTQGDNPLISSNIAGYLGAAYDFSINGEFDEAIITFKYDESLGVIGEDFQPRVYHLDEDTGILNEVENQIVENGKVSVTVEHFSIYLLLNKVEFDKVWESEIKPPEYEGNGKTGVDIVFVIDSSGSMSSNDGSKLRHTAVKQFIDKLGENDRAAVIDFDSYATLYQAFTDDKTALYTAVDRVDSSGGTSLSAGMSLAISQFTDSSYSRTDAYKYIVFLTDGDGSYSTSYTTDAANNGIIVYTIGLGSGVQASVLKAIANGTGGKYYFASTASTLPNIYLDVSFETIDYTTDSNEDKISDYYTTLLNDGTLPLSNGSTEFKGVFDMYDPDSSDWDGDGLLNGEEIVIKVNKRTGKTYAEMVSNPIYKDSDNDGLSDYDEKVRGTSSLVKDYTNKGALENLTDNFSLYFEIQAESGFHIFDWDKRERSTTELINYFYEYASEDSTNVNAEKIKAQKNWENAIKVVSTVTDICNIAKDAVDICSTLGTDYKEKSDALKKAEEDAKKSRIELINIINSGTKELTDSEFENVTKVVSSVLNALNDITGDGIEIKTISSLVSKSVKTYAKLREISVPIKSLSKFADKYSKFMDKDILGPMKNSDAVSAVFKLVDVGIETAETINTFSKIEANSTAFIEYTAIFEYISKNAKEDFTRKAALDVMDVFLDEQYSYWDKVVLAFSKDLASEFVDLGLDVVGNVVPVVNVVKASWEVIDALCGFSKDGENSTRAMVYVAIHDACRQLLLDNYYTSGINAFAFKNEVEGERYLTQIIQCMIAGNEVAKEWADNMSITKWLAFIVEGVSKDEYKEWIDTQTGYCYEYAEKWDLTLSPKLPSPTITGSGGGGSW